MSYISVPSILTALVDPLRHSLKDSDPYVRKTAAICVAKLYMHDRKLVDRQGFIGMLRDLLADGNPTVVANAVAAAFVSLVVAGVGRSLKEVTGLECL